MAVDIQLTPREIAIAKGEDPEAVVVSQSSAESSNDGSQESTSEEGSEEVGQEESEEVYDGEEEGSQAAEEENGDVGWLTGSAREMATSYGFSDDELADFSSEAEMMRAGALLDRRLSKIGQSANQSDDSAPAGDPPSLPADPSFEALDEQKFIDTGFSEDELLLVKRMNAHSKLLSEVHTYYQHQREEMQQRELARVTEEFHSLVDELDERTYGRVFDGNGQVQGDLDKQVNDNRQKVWEAEQTLVAGIIERAREMGIEAKLPSRRTMIARAAQLAFPPSTGTRSGGSRTDAARAQASRKRSVGRSGGPSTPPADEDPYSPRSIANHPRLKSFFERANQESGAT